MRNPLAPTRLAVGAAALAALAAPISYAAPELAAQHRGKGAMQGGHMGHQGTMLERVLRHGDSFDLTDDQRGRLEELRADLVERRVKHAAALIRLSSEARAGLLEDGAARNKLREMRKASGKNEKRLHEHVAAILTEEQMAGLKEAAAKRDGKPRMRRGGMRGGHGGWMRRRGMWPHEPRLWWLEPGADAQWGDSEPEDEGGGS